MLDKARPYVDPIFKHIAKPFLRIHPNWLTLIGFSGGFLFLFFIYNEQYLYALLSFLAIFADSLDGTVARLSGKESKFGGFFDASLDRITDATMIAAFGVAQIVRWEIVVSLIVASVMISYTRAKAEQMAENKIKLAVGIIERPERILILLFATIMLFLQLEPSEYTYTWIWTLNIYEWLFLILFDLSLITVLQRMYKAWKVLS